MLVKEFSKVKFLFHTYKIKCEVNFIKKENNSFSQKNLTGRIRTIDLGITIVNFYSPPLYQLSYGELRGNYMNQLPQLCFLQNCELHFVKKLWEVSLFFSVLWYRVRQLMHMSRQCVRVVKEPDLKSGGLCPRRFESCRWRYYHTSVDSSVVRIPAFQAGGPGSIPGRRMAPLV